MRCGIAIAPLDTLNTAHNALGTALRDGRTAVTTFLDHLEKSRHLEDNWKKNVLER